jgi:hypothetical protein
MTNIWPSGALIHFNILTHHNCNICLNRVLNSVPLRNPFAVTSVLTANTPLRWQTGKGRRATHHAGRAGWLQVCLSTDGDVLQGICGCRQPKMYEAVVT